MTVSRSEYHAVVISVERIEKRFFDLRREVKVARKDVAVLEKALLSFDSRLKRVSNRQDQDSKVYERSLRAIDSRVSGVQRVLDCKDLSNVNGKLVEDLEIKLYNALEGRNESRLVRD